MHDRLATTLGEDLSAKIVASRARGVLIDISGLDIVDFSSADSQRYRFRLTHAGRRDCVVGMRPAVAITLVELGLELSGVKTALNVERGMDLLRSRLQGEFASGEAPDGE